MPLTPLRTVAEARALFHYNRAVFDRFVRRVERLDWKVASRRRGIGHESLFGTLVHVLNVHEVWLGYILAGRGDELEALFARKSRHPTDWVGFHAYEKAVWSAVDAYLAAATPRALGRRVKAPWMPGRYTARDALLQTTFEQAHHLGEVIGALWQDDVEPPEMTWIRVERPPARSRPAR